MTDVQRSWNPRMTRWFSSFVPQPFSSLVLLEMFLIIAIGLSVSLLLAPSYNEVAWTGAKGALASVVTVASAPVSLVGAVLTPVRLPFAFVLLTRVLALVFLAGAVVVGLITNEADSEAFYALMFLTIAYLFFAVLRDVRAQAMEQYGALFASLVSIVLVLLIPGITGTYLLTQVLIPPTVSSEVFSVAFALVETIFLAFVFYLWYKVHISSYKAFLSQVLVVVRDLEETQARVKYRSLFVNSTLCSTVQGQSHIILSLSLFFVVMGVEIYLGTVLYDQWDDAVKRGLILFMKVAIPATLHLGFIYTSSQYHKDEKVSLALIVALPVFFVAVLAGDSLAADESTQELGLLVKYGTPASMLYWICMLYMHRHNKRCYQLVTPVLCYAVFLPFFVIYPLHTEEAIEAIDVAVLMGLSQLLGLFLFVCFWLAETCATLSAHCRLLWLRTKYIQYYDGTQLFYVSIWFALSFALVNQWHSTDNAADKSIVIALTMLLSLALIISLVLQQASLRSKVEDPVTFNELLLGKAPQSPEYLRLARKKKVFQAIIYGAMALLSIVLSVCIAVYHNKTHVSHALASVLGGSLVILVLGALGLEVKFKLRALGERWIAGTLTVLWLFLFGPLLGVTPLLYLLGYDPDTLLLFASCAIFLVILLFVALISIILNSLFLALETEKLTKYCVSHLTSYLNSVAVAMSDEVARSLIAQFRNIGSTELTQLMHTNTYVGEHILEEDERYNKEVLPAKQSKRKEAKRITRKLSMKNKQPEEKEKGIIELLFGNCFKRQEDPDEQLESKESEPFVKDVSMVYDLEAIEEEVSEIQAPESQLDAIHQSFQAEESVLDVQVLLQEECFSAIKQSERLQREWMSHLFYTFAHGDASTANPYLSQFNLRELVFTGGISRFVKPHRCDLIYTKLTTAFSPGMMKKFRRRIDSAVFYSELIPELAKIVYPKRALQFQLLFENYLYPNITMKIPAMRYAARELGKLSESVVPESQSIHEEQSSQPPHIFQGSSPASSTDEVHETMQDRIEKRQIPSETAEASTNPVHSIDKYAASSHRCCRKFTNSLSKCGKKIVHLVRKCCISLKTFFTLAQQEPEETPIVAQPSEQLALVQSPEWDELCESIPQLLDKVTTQWSEDRHTYTIQSLKFNFANFLEVISHVLEVAFYCLVAFHSEIRWLDWLYPAEALNSTSMEYDDVWFGSFAGAVGIVVFFMIMVVPVKKLTQEGRLGLNKDLTEAQFPSIQFLLVKMFGFVSTTLYLFVIKALLSVFSCRSGSDEWILVKDNSIECFEGIHWLYLAVGIVAILIYYPSATIMYPISMFQNRALDLKFTSTFLIIESQGKLLIAGTLTFFYQPQYIVVHLSVTAAVCVGLLIYSYKAAPCLVQSYNLWKTWTYAIPIWTMACAAFNYYSHYQAVAFFLLVGGILIILLTLAFIHCQVASAVKKAMKSVQPSLQDLNRADVNVKE